MQTQLVFTLEVTNNGRKVVARMEIKEQLTGELQARTKEIREIDLSNQQNIHYTDMFKSWMKEWCES